MFKNVYSLYSAFCTHSAFYSQSAVCVLHSVCILPLVRSLQSAVCVLHWPIFSVIRHTCLSDAPQTLQRSFSKLTNWKLNQNVRRSHDFLAMFTLTTTKSFPTTLVYGHSPMWTKAKKVTYFDQKQKNPTYRCQMNYFECKMIHSSFRSHWKWITKKMMSS